MTIGGKVGWGNSTSGEGQDRASLKMPGVQEELLKAVKATGKPMVMVLFNGRPMTINWASENIDSILEVWFTGPQGGKAIANVLFGDANPGGKLPITIPRATGQIPMYYNHKRGAGYDREVDKKRGGGSLESIFGGGYTDIENSPLYHFGFGLSYSKFEFSDYDLSHLKVDSNGEIKVSAFVKNVSDVDGDEVVQFYIQDTDAKVTRPVKELVGFKRVTLQSGEMKKVTMTLKMSQLGFYDENMHFVVEPGNMKIMIGNSSKDIFFTDYFEIVGKKRRLEGRRTYLSAVNEQTVDKIVKTEHEIIIEKKNYSMKSTLGELLEDEAARNILIDEFGEKFLNNPQLERAKGMSLKMIKMMAGSMMPKGAMDKVLLELKKL